MPHICGKNSKYLFDEDQHNMTLESKPNSEIETTINHGWKNYELLVVQFPFTKLIIDQTHQIKD